MTNHIDNYRRLTTSPLNSSANIQPNSWMGRALSVKHYLQAQLTLENIKTVALVGGAVFAGILIGKWISVPSVQALNNPQGSKLTPQPTAPTGLQTGGSSPLFNAAHATPNFFMNDDKLASTLADERVLVNILNFKKSSQTLINEVDNILKDGGKLISKSNPDNVGTGGAYLIKDKTGKTIAIFKPEDEGTWRPNNPNPQYRKRALSEDDIYFHQANSWEQGDQAKRQQFAEIVFTEGTLRTPKGAVVTMTSDQFFNADAAAKGIAAPMQTKRGYLQEWIGGTLPVISYHPTVKPNVQPSMAALDFTTNPIMDQISLDEFQEIAIMDMLMYNEDRNPGNLLVTHDKNGVPSLIPIDHDAILPWKLNSLFGIYDHPRLEKPLTEASKELLQKLTPDYIEALASKMELSEQTPINAKAIATVLKRFTDAGASLRDVERYISFGKRGSPETSKFWKLMEEAKTNALNELPEQDRNAYQYNRHLRRADWCETQPSWCERLTPQQKPDAALWQKRYQKNQSKRIDRELNAHFWKQFDLLLDKEIESSFSNCIKLSAQDPLCWKGQELFPGVNHYKFSGVYEGLNQRFELLKINKDSKAKLKVQDARGLFKEGERPEFGRLQLTEVASRVPNAIAAISGGNFHYTPPKGEFYEWDGPAYVEGDPVGETVVNGKIKATNPKLNNWGAFRIAQSGETSFADTFKDGVDIEKKTPKYSLGAVPVLVKDGKAVTTNELKGPALKFKPGQACAPGIQFQSHMNMQHARASVCKTEEGDHLLLMVEGRRKEAEGLRLTQLGSYLKTLGCKDALNLDGGGTADLVTKNKEGVFFTTVTGSDPKGKRPIASAIVITEG